MRERWKLELNQINEPCLRKEAPGFMSSAVLQDQCCETQLQGSTKRVEVRSEVCMLWGWGGVGREGGKKGLEGLDLSRVLGARSLPTGQW